MIIMIIIIIIIHNNNNLQCFMGTKQLKFIEMNASNTMGIMVNIVITKLFRKSQKVMIFISCEQNDIYDMLANNYEYQFI